MRRRFAAQDWPTIIDTKKKEMLGRFKNNGRSWESAPVPVNDHDFKRDSVGSAIPWGLYETPGNRGHVFVAYPTTLSGELSSGAFHFNELF